MGGHNFLPKSGVDNKKFYAVLSPLICLRFIDGLVCIPGRGSRLSRKEAKGAGQGGHVTRASTGSFVRTKSRTKCKEPKSERNAKSRRDCGGRTEQSEFSMNQYRTSTFDPAPD
jgi:hypothetical protein